MHGYVIMQGLLEHNVTLPILVTPIQKFSMVRFVFTTGVGGYTYLLEPLWWTGMVISE